MRLRKLSLSLLVLLLLACQAVTGIISEPAPPLSTAAQPTAGNLTVGTLPPQSTGEIPAGPTQNPLADSALANEAAATSTAAATYAAENSSRNDAAAGALHPAGGVGYQVHLHPDGALYVGDQVSFEVIAPPGSDMEGTRASVSLTDPVNTRLGSAAFAKYGIAGRDQATLYWAWDTAGLASGTYSLTYSIQPAGPVFTNSVTLLPAGQLPPAEAGAAWAETTSKCCVLHYITGTAAERDLEILTEMVDSQAAQASQELGAKYEEPVSISFIPRVLGHGGFTSQEISISYLDRNYAGSSPQIVLHHELVHALDGELGGELRPTLLVEGLAVYLSGGHFKPEALLPRAAALLDIGWYLPLEPLADDFYPSQHEIGYMEAGALLDYMVDRWGWQAFSDFYRDIHPAPEGGSQSQAIDAALQSHFGITFAALEDEFKGALRGEKVTDDTRQDVRLTVKQYDLVRAYQEAYDPSAYFMTAWLPDGEQMRKHGIVADYLRHPAAPENLALEALLVASDAYLRQGDYPKAAQYLDAIEQVLKLVQTGSRDALYANQLAADYLAIVNLLLSRGYQAQSISLQDSKAQAWCIPNQGTTNTSGLIELKLVRSPAGWSIAEQLNY